MENYTKDPLKSIPQKQGGGSLSKGLWALAVLLVIGGLFTYIGSQVIGDYAERNDPFEFADSGFASLEDVGINTDLSGIPGIPDRDASRMSETWDFRKTANLSFYEKRVNQAWEDGNLTNWADAQIELAAAYVDQGGGQYAQQAAEALKAVIANTDLKNRIRAKAMRSLAGIFCRSGLDKTVFDKIYTGEYAQFYEEGDPMLAGRRMMETSYEMYPRARTAVSVAHMYIDPIVNGDLTDTEKADSRDKGLTLLRNAEVLARDEYNPNEIDGEYSSYLFWRAVSYGQLAMEYDEYIDDAEEAYGKLFGYIDGYTGTYNTSVTNIIPFSHLRYVNFLTEVYGDEAADQISKHLDIIVVLAANDPVPNSNTFLKYIYNKKKDYDTDGTYSHWLSDARVYSDSYDAFLNSFGLPALN